jgi:hypothetical protein
MVVAYLLGIVRCSMYGGYNLLFIIFYMQGTIVIAAACRHKWFNSVPKLILLSMFLAFDVGCERWFVINRLTMVPLGGASQLSYLAFFLCALPEALAGVFLAWAFFRFAPDNVKKLTIGGRFYLKNEKAEQYYRSPLTVSISVILILMIFGITLFEVIGTDYVLKSFSDRMVVSTEKSETAAAAERIAARPVSFDLATYFSNPAYHGTMTVESWYIYVNFLMILLILNGIVPFAIAIATYIRRKLTVPLGRIVRIQESFINDHKDFTVSFVKYHTFSLSFYRVSF